MKCKKCGTKLTEGYLDIVNRINGMCSRCLVKEQKPKKPKQKDILLWG